MTDVTPEEIQLDGESGHTIHVDIYEPPADVIGVIQILHGLGEHSRRYGRFAAAAVDRGYVVCVHNHRGHGEHGHPLGYFGDRKGWHLLVDDAKRVHDYLLERYAGKPLVLLGHSMGSYVAQTFTMHYGAKLKGLILSGSTWPQRLQLIPAMLIARIVSLRYSKSGKSPLLHKLGFGNFNKPFEPARTELDWLSRDEHEVDLYVNDPLCGGPYTCGLWIDLLGALYELGSDHSLSRIRSDLPILITGGGDDPIGGEDGMTRLAMHYAQTSHSRMSLKIYQGGRHEMLNETNRDEVTCDWLDWIAARLRAA
jgi:alpha-beta hydrolase superfamily lysophospholipase